MRLWKTVSCLPQRKWRVGFCWFWLPLVCYVGAPAAFKTSFLWEKGKYSKHRSDFMTFLYRTSSTTYRLPTSNRALGRNRSSRRTSALALPQIFFFDLFLALHVFITWTAVFPRPPPCSWASLCLCLQVFAIRLENLCCSTFQTPPPPSNTWQQLQANELICHNQQNCGLCLSTYMKQTADWIQEWSEWTEDTWKIKHAIFL